MGNSSKEYDWLSFYKSWILAPKLGLIFLINENQLADFSMMFTGFQANLSKFLAFSFIQMK